MKSAEFPEPAKAVQPPPTERVTSWLNRSDLQKARRWIDKVMPTPCIREQERGQTDREIFPWSILYGGVR
eukprot:4114567-Amphidinium_carterae.1